MQALADLGLYPSRACGRVSKTARRLTHCREVAHCFSRGRWFGAPPTWPYRPGLATPATSRSAARPRGHRVGNSRSHQASGRAPWRKAALRRPSEEAVKAFEAALERRPARLLSLRGLARANVELGNDEITRHYYRRLADQLRNADHADAVLAEAKRFLDRP